MSDWPRKPDQIPKGMEECWFCEGDGDFANGMRCPECKGVQWLPADQVRTVKGKAAQPTQSQHRER